MRASTYCDMLKYLPIWHTPKEMLGISLASFMLGSALGFSLCVVLAY